MFVFVLVDVYVCVCVCVCGYVVMCVYTCMCQNNQMFTDKLLARGWVWVVIKIKKDHEQTG